MEIYTVCLRQFCVWEESGAEKVAGVRVSYVWVHTNLCKNVFVHAKTFYFVKIRDEIKFLYFDCTQDFIRKRAGRQQSHFFPIIKIK